MPGRGQRHDLGGVPVLVVENVQDYRECVPHYISKEDIVLEAGAAQGCTTAVVANYAAEVIGIDKSPFNVNVAQGRYPQIAFHEIDAFDISGIQKLNRPFTKIFLDISGSQPVGPLATLLEKYERAFPTVNLFVVKSYRLKKLVGSSTVFPEQVLGTTRNRTAAFMLRRKEDNTTAHGNTRSSICTTVARRAAVVCAAVAAFSAGFMFGTVRRRNQGKSG
ncbi:hypothetical protein Agub_g5046 [Astrephomene gubernaculifera]|uniref:Methyltransferase domain-containing protein n=1 Tax=Astrephomene gubernaculifera TaxID=47775 RepID=A0AAD3HK96_9CHLO|nr:hypothetical protein Agub_g5046 [Astrephomene gubernaculifera]